MSLLKFKNENGEWQTITGTSSVVSFNGRAGAIKPRTGDYTAEMVGADVVGSADNALNDAKTYTDNKVADLVNSAPETLDTLKELSDALGDDPNFATTITNQIGNKLDKTDIADWAKAESKPVYTASEVGAAPSGYGLGEAIVYVEDATTINKTGWYRSKTGMPSGATCYVMHVQYTSTGHAYQMAVSVAQNPQQISFRWLMNGVWGDWQELSPQMANNIPYLTMERIGGKPVYKRYNSTAGIIEYHLEGEEIWKPYANALGAASSNPNLLHNWYFANPINQRGQTEYSTAGYGVDQWHLRGNTKATLCDGYIRLTALGAGFGFNQRIGNYAELLGKTVTISVLINDANYADSSRGIRFGLCSSNSPAANTTPFPGTYTKSKGLITYTVTLPDSIAHSGLNFEMFSSYVSDGDYVDVVAAKLELGSVQTLAHRDTDGNWVLNEIPDYNEELLKCCMSKADSTDEYANNKKTPSSLGIAPASIGAVPLTGGKMTGALQNALDSKGVAGFLGWNGQTFLQSCNVDTNQCRQLIVNNLTYNNDDNVALNLARVENGGVAAVYTVLHTGNMSTFGCTKIQTGTYVGTGTYDASNPCSLTFNFAPKVVIITSNYTGHYINGGHPWVNPSPYGWISGDQSSNANTLTWSGNTLSWYSTSGEAPVQLNIKNVTYHWVAIG